MTANNKTNPNGRVRTTRQSVITNTFYQMPRFLTAGEFAGTKISNNARVLYTLLIDRHRISVKNGWLDENCEVYVYFKREEMEQQLGLSERTVAKVMQELKDFSLVEEKKQGLNKPNKIYVMSPIIGGDDDPTPYLDPDTDYNPDKDHDDNFYEDYSEDFSGDNTNYTAGHKETILPTSDVCPQSRKNYASDSYKNATSGGVKNVSADPQNLSPSNNKLINNNKRNNNMSDNEVSKTTATAVSFADAEPPAAAEAAVNTLIINGQLIPYPQIVDMYNSLCETTGLRPIKSINGKRKNQTATRFKEHGLNGFADLFGKVSSSIFLCGGGERSWRADYDWLMDAENMQKVLEGKYDNAQNNIPLPPMLVDNNLALTPTNPSQKRPEQSDPFLDRALAAYATAAQAVAG